MEQKHLELLKPITDKINAAIKEVADAKGLSVVVGKNVVIYGGVDIIQEVLAKITGK
ncbi:OmpH family outer membrane protein [Sporomusa acidovorans]|uniref:OmpH family outer membrane protein n=1 Tax=Sporomusa acidovorans TaxID=112900 RepID=UPI000B816294|nr:OmpH family outer membrane protein [Sporomusa acidovorans]